MKKNNYAISNLLDYDYFSQHYKLIAIDLSKKIELEILHLKQQINFIDKLKEDNGTGMFFIIDVMDDDVIDRQTEKDKYNQKKIILNLRQTVLNQVFVIILMHLFKLKEI